MKIFALLCFVVITGEPLILNLRSSTDSDARTRTRLVGSIDYKSAITDIVRKQNSDVLSYTELII